MRKDKLTQSLVILAVLTLLGSAGYFGYKEIRKALNKSGGSGQTSPQPSPDKGEGETQDQVYTHPDYGFTLRYPGNLKLGKFPEGEGEIILLQGASTPSPEAGEGGGEVGFQIFISPYNETEEFSKEVILKADPKMKIENDKTISLGSEEISALSFDSSGDTGATHEVWFVADGNLYQCTSFKQYREQMERILQSLRFN
jgi:hypothetical protein